MCCVKLTSTLSLSLDTDTVSQGQCSVSPTKTRPRRTSPGCVYQSFNRIIGNNRFNGHILLILPYRKSIFKTSVGKLQDASSNKFVLSVCSVHSSLRKSQNHIIKSQQIYVPLMNISLPNWPRRCHVSHSADRRQSHDKKIGLNCLIFGWFWCFKRSSTEK